MTLMRKLRPLFTVLALAAFAVLGSWGLILHGPDVSLAQLGRSPRGARTVTFPISIAKGGTGAITAAAARTALVVPNVATAAEWTAAQNFNEVALTDGANISWNWETQQAARVTLTDNRTLDNPTADTFPAGRFASLRVIQDAGGTNTLSYGNAYDFPGGTTPTLTTDGDAVDLLTCYSDGTAILCTISLDMK
ncbi:hypothetical protein CMI37_35400 [Candidatus Pacearchaeota archaeon]|nr:hypothetical protein [Candidatus Pacearchaeota archaeon]